MDQKERLDHAAIWLDINLKRKELSHSPAGKTGGKTACIIFHIDGTEPAGGVWGSV